SKATNDGLGHEYLWSQFSNRWTIEYSILATMLITSFFATTFLELKLRAVRINSLFQLWRGLMLFTALAVPFTNTFPAIGLLLVVELSLIVVGTWRAWRTGYRPARLFLASFVLPLVASVVYILFSFGVLPLQVLAANILLLFLATLALLWS